MSRRLVARQVLPDAGGDELILDRGEARRALGMVRAHVVLEAIGMRMNAGHAISSYRIEYNFRMLLKAEFQPSSVGTAPIERAASNIILGKETQVRLPSPACWRAATC